MILHVLLLLATLSWLYFNFLLLAKLSFSLPIPFLSLNLQCSRFEDSISTTRTNKLIKSHHQPPLPLRCCGPESSWSSNIAVPRLHTSDIYFSEHFFHILARSIRRSELLKSTQWPVLQAFRKHAPATPRRLDSRVARPNHSSAALEMLRKKRANQPSTI